MNLKDSQLSEHYLRVREFMTKAGQAVVLEPATMQTFDPSDQTLILRGRLALEEQLELCSDGMGLTIGIDITKSEAFLYTLGALVAGYDSDDIGKALEEGSLGELLETLQSSPIIPVTKDGLRKGEVSVQKTHATNFIEVLDGLADVSVINTGTMVSFGVPDLPILEETDLNNLGKFGEGHFIDEHGKLNKPPGHMPPDFYTLQESGYNYEVYPDGFGDTIGLVLNRMFSPVGDTTWLAMVKSVPQEVKEGSRYNAEKFLAGLDRISLARILFDVTQAYFKRNAVRASENLQETEAEHQVA